MKYFLPVVVLFFMLGQASVAVAEGGTQPVWFWKNKGQWPQNIQFQVEREGGLVYFENKGLTFLLYDEEQVDAIWHGFHHDKPKQKVTDSIAAHAFRLVFEGASPVAATALGKQTPDFRNYFMGNDAKQWTSHVYGHEALHYKAVYPGIDWICSGKTGQLKSDWVVNPGGNPSQIAWKPEGLDSFRVEKNKLIYYTRFGAIEEGRPIAWQNTPGGKKWIEVAYRKKGKAIGFDLPQGYDPKYPLIIDPTLIFFTYTGSPVDNWGTTATYDESGHMYTGGVVFGPGYPTTTGAFSILYGGRTGNAAFSSFDCNIAKFSPDGRRLLYSTYLGGLGSDLPHSLVINKNNQIVVFGTTSSSNFPIGNQAFMRNFMEGPPVSPLTQGSLLYAEGADIFITVLPEPGQPLLSSTYFGGGGSDGVQDITSPLVRNYGDSFRGDAVVDSENNIIIGTYSTSNISFVSGARWGEADGLVVKFLPDLSGIIWARWIGGNGADAIYDVEIDGLGFIYACGGTNSAQMNITGNSYRNLPYNPGALTQIDRLDGFLYKLDGNAGNVLAATLVGTPFYDQAYLLSVDTDNNPIVFGQTRGEILQTSRTYGYSGGGQFIQKYNSLLMGLVFSTSFGTRQSPNISPTAFSVNDCGQIYLAGWGGPNISGNEDTYVQTNTQGLPTTSDAFRGVTDNNDLYFMVLTRNAEMIRYGSFFGEFGGRGDHVDGGTSRFDPTGVVYHAICGCLISGSTNGPAGSPGSFSPNIRSANCNNGAIKFDFGDLLARFTIDANVRTCPPYNLAISNTSLNASYYVWDFGNGDTLRTTSTGVNYTYTRPGKYIIRLRAFNPLTCQFGSEAIDSVVVGNPFPFQTDTTSLLFCKDDTLKISFPDIAQYRLSWSPSQYLSNPTSWDQTITPLGSQLYTINISNDTCEIKRFVKLTNEEVKLEFDSIIAPIPCENLFDVKLDNSRSIADKTWWFITPTDSVENKVIEQVWVPGNYQIRLKGVKGACEDNVFFDLKLKQNINLVEAAFEAKPIFRNCTDIALKISNSSRFASTYLWDFGNGQTSFEPEPTFTFTDTTTVKTVILRAFQGNCRSEDTLVINRPPLLVPNVITADGNEFNACFKIKNLPEGTGIDIFNRWGKRVFSQNDYRNNWCPDGREPGSYYFNLRFEEGGSCHGLLEVLR